MSGKTFVWKSVPTLVLLGTLGVSSTTLNDFSVEEEQVEEESVVLEEDTVNPELHGIYENRIVFGQSAALTGLNGASGAGMRLGILAAFHEANANGGVHGRTLELITRDDGYEPDQAITNSSELIDDINVFSLIGAVGTPTSRAAVKVCQLRNVPYIGPLTGAAFLREEDQVVINLRASYAQETEEMVQFLTERVGADRIAILYQDDSFGKAGYDGTKEAMDRRELKLVRSGVYRRNSLDVRTAVLDIYEAKPDAVIMIGSYRPSAEFILWARTVGVNALFINISFVNSNALAEALGEGGTGVLVSQVVPFPGGDLQIARNYRSSLAIVDPDAEPEFFSFEGYLVGRLALLGLEDAGRDVTRESFLQSIRAIESVDVEGFEFDFGSDNQASDRVFMTVLGEDGAYRAVNSVSDIELPWEN